MVSDITPMVVDMKDKEQRDRILGSLKVRNLIQVGDQEISTPDALMRHALSLSKRDRFFFLEKYN